jgi:predicted nucleic acid-binding protein
VRYLIDSDFVIDHFLGQATATNLLGRLDDDGGIAIGVVTYMEVYQGLLRDAAGGDPRTRLDDFLAGRPVLSFTPEIAQRCAHLRDDLRRRSRPVRPRYLDLINAATAIHHDLAIVTRNTPDYEDIPGLRLHA